MEIALNGSRRLVGIGDNKSSMYVFKTINNSLLIEPLQGQLKNENQH